MDRLSFFMEIIAFLLFVAATVYGPIMNGRQFSSESTSILLVLIAVWLLLSSVSINVKIHKD